MDRIAVYAGTRNIYHDMLVSAKSLLYHKGADRVVFLIEDDIFPEQLPECISYINVSNQTFFNHTGPNFSSRWTYMVMMRTALTKLFPDAPRILSLDHDTIVRKPIDYIWNLDLDSGGHYYAAVEEKQIGNRKHPYHNFGVVLHNLALLRRDGMDDIIINTINTVHFPYCEQDAVNSLCRDRFYQLPPEYNAMSFNRPVVPEEDIIIKHYAANNGHLRSCDDYRYYERMMWRQILSHDTGDDSVHLWTRHDIINSFISRRGLSAFLEVGTDTGISFRNVHADRIVSVDPNPRTPATHHMTSDAFFASSTDKFDIVFIDGLHECYQVERDILNALDHLNPGGVIVLHDCLPRSERMQEHHTSSQYYEWTGDVWKAFVKCRHILPYEMYVIDTDYGCGIIDTGITKRADTSHLPINMESMTYEQFVGNRSDWMNIRYDILSEQEVLS